MFNSNPPLSAADVAAVVGNQNNGNGFGWGNEWWIIILFALFGWGNGGYGFGGNAGGRGCGGAATSADIQRGFDNQTVVNKLNGLENGLCSLGYDQLAQINGTNTTVMQTGFGITNAIQADTVANMQNTNMLASQLADCCCENRAAIAQVRYDMATNACATNTAIANAARDIVDNANMNYRALHDEFVAFQMSSKDDKIACLTQQLADARLAASQKAQNEYLVNVLRPTPVPAYAACNPYTGQIGWSSAYNGNGCCHNAVSCC